MDVADCQKLEIRKKYHFVKEYKEVKNDQNLEIWLFLEKFHTCVQHIFWSVYIILNIVSTITPYQLCIVM